MKQAQKEIINHRKELISFFYHNYCIEIIDHYRTSLGIFTHGIFIKFL